MVIYGKNEREIKKLHEIKNIDGEFVKKRKSKRENVTKRNIS